MKTIVQQIPITSTQDRRDRLAAALEQAAILNPFAEIVDPVAWQRDQRHDRALPGRELEQGSGDFEAGACE